MTNHGWCKAEQGERVIRPSRVSGTPPGWSRIGKVETPDRNSSSGGLEKWLPAHQGNLVSHRIRLTDSTGTRAGWRKGHPAFAFLALLIGGFDPLCDITELAIHFVNFLKLFQSLNFFTHFLENHTERVDRILFHVIHRHDF